MTKQIQTFFDHVNNCTDATTLLKHIAKMMALQQTEYTDAFAADELRDALAIDMVKYGNAVASATFRSSDMQPSLDKMSIQDYVDEVVTPISTMLTRRILSQVERPYTNTFCNIEVASV